MEQEIYTAEHFNKKPIITYFHELINDISFASEKIENVILVLITRKGYGLLKTMMKFEPMLEKHVHESGLHYISDRYILKLANEKEEIEGKKVYIFDDTITNGNNMFYYYCMFKKKGAAQVIPNVFIASTEFLAKMAKYKKETYKGNSDYIEQAKLMEFKRIYKEQEDQQEKFSGLLNSFYNDFKFKMVLSADEAAKFSIQETLWFQENLNPMVMDLPVFRYEDEKKEREIILTEEEFKRICTSTSKWQFVKNSYNVLDQEVRCDFFQLNDDLIYRQFHNLFFNFVVKCKFIECEQGIKIVFIPFAMIKSGSMTDVWRCFCSLLGDTEYYRHILSYATKTTNEENELDEDVILDLFKRNHNISRGVFRAIIFSLSNYIGYLFQEKLTEEIGKTIYFDTKYLGDHCDKDFVSTFENEYSKLNKNEYVRRIADIKNSGFSTVLI